MTLRFPTTVDAVRDALTDDPYALSHLIEFDSPFIIGEDGTIDSAPNRVHAPELWDEQLDSSEWSMLTGYSGQHGYSGPVMHNSEFLGGRLARDILDTPGTYVAVVAYWSPDELTPDDIPEDHPVRPVDSNEYVSPGVATCGGCGLSWDDSIPTSMTPAPSARCPFETFHPDQDTAEGWTIARLTA